MTRKPAWLFLPLCMLAILSIGCRNGDDVAEDGGPTDAWQIRAIFVDAKTAVASGETEQFADCLTPQNQEQLAGLYLAKGAMLLMLGDLDEEDDTQELPQQQQIAIREVRGVFGRHAVFLEDLEQTQAAPGADTEETESVADTITNKPAFIGEMSAIFFAIGDRPPGQNLLNCRLTDEIEVDGEMATGTLVRQDGEKSTLQFQKCDDEWRIHMDKF